MHELSIALSILDLAEEQAQLHGGGRVAVIRLQLGPLSGVVKESLQSAFELARESCSMEDANLVIEEVPLVSFCPVCQVQRTLASARDLCCPECGAVTPEIVHGRELEVVSLELES